DNGMTGNIAGGAYKIKYSSVAIITGSQFDSPPASYTVTTIDISTDTTPGEEHSRDITGLLEGTSYWFAMKTEDEANNWAVWNSSQDVSSVNNVAYSCPKDSAPASITNLSALTGSTGGEIDLTWSVPGDDGWTGAITGGKYRIRYATYSTVDWTSASGEWIDFDDKYELELDTDTNAAGEMHGRTMTSLHEGVTYYFRINTGDEKPNWSGLSNNATAWAKVSEVLVLPSPVSNLTALAGSWSGDVVLKWTAPGNDGTVGTAAGYLLRYSSNYISAADFYALWVSTWVPSYGWGPKASKSEESYTITGLITGTTYWFVLKAYSDAGNYAIWNSSGDNSAVNNNNWSLPGISPGTTSFLHITEVMANAPTELTDEYVEVYNAGTTAIDLNGYSIRDILEADDIYDDWATNYDLVGGAVIEDAYRNGASTSSTILQPGYYALFMDSDYGQGTPSQVYYFKPNCIILAVDDTNIGNALSNTTDGVGLWTSPAGVHIDSFTWSSTPVDMPWTKITSTGAGKIDTSGDWDDSVSSSPARQHPTYVSYNMLASEISTQTAASASVSQGDTNKTVLACKVPGHDNSISQNLIGVRLSTAGTTTTMLKDDDISAIKVWQDVDGDNAYSAGDSYLGTLTYNVSYAVWECQQTVTMATGSSGRKIVFTIDIAAGGTNGRKFQAKLPQYNGLMVDSGYHGPYDTSCANSGIITIGAAGDTTAPAAVTAISASTYTVTGYVQLEWQSPGDDDWSDDLPSGSSFTIQYATFTTVDWSTSSAQIIIDASGTSTGTVVSTTTLLSAETTYYFRLWTNDEIPNYSGISYGATVWCRIRPEAVTTLSSLALDDGSGDVQLTWIAPGDDGTTGDITDGQWKIRYSTFSSVDWTTDSDEWTDFDDKYELLFDTTSVSPLSGQTQNITGLHGNVTYYFRLWTRDENTGANSPGNWSLVSNASTVTVTAVLGISISPSTYDYGNLNASSAVVNGTTITVTNTGNITETYSLFSSSAIGSGKGWLIKDSPGNDEFSLSAGFNTVEPSSTTFVADNILSTTTVKCTAAKFALNETGIDVIKDALRNIWFLIKTPDSTSTIDEKEITATITAGTP
ncbi:MAG: lamin tail domain-containing protein, partial [bacterium]